MLIALLGLLMRSSLPRSRSAPAAPGRWRSNAQSPPTSSRAAVPRRASAASSQRARRLHHHPLQQLPRGPRSSEGRAWRRRRVQLREEPGRHRHRRPQRPLQPPLLRARPERREVRRPRVGPAESTARPAGIAQVHEGDQRELVPLARVLQAQDEDRVLQVQPERGRAVPGIGSSRRISASSAAARPGPAAAWWMTSRPPVREHVRTLASSLARASAGSPPASSARKSGASDSGAERSWISSTAGTPRAGRAPPRTTPRPSPPPRPSTSPVGALEVHQLHHVVVERALVHGEQPVSHPLRRAAAPPAGTPGCTRPAAPALRQSPSPRTPPTARPPATCRGGSNAGERTERLQSEGGHGRERSTTPGASKPSRRHPERTTTVKWRCPLPEVAFDSASRLAAALAVSLPAVAQEPRSTSAAGEVHHQRRHRASALRGGPELGGGAADQAPQHDAQLLKGLPPPKMVAVTGASAGNIDALIAAIEWCRSDDAAPRRSGNAFYESWIPVGWDGPLRRRPAPASSTATTAGSGIDLGRSRGRRRGPVPGGVPERLHRSRTAADCKAAAPPTAADDAVFTRRAFLGVEESFRRRGGEGEVRPGVQAGGRHHHHQVPPTLLTSPACPEGRRAPRRARTTCRSRYSVNQDGLTIETQRYVTALRAESRQGRFGYYEHSFQDDHTLGRTCTCPRCRRRTTGWRSMTCRADRGLERVPARLRPAQARTSAR